MSQVFFQTLLDLVCFLNLPTHELRVATVLLSYQNVNS